MPAKRGLQSSHRYQRRGRFESREESEGGMTCGQRITPGGYRCDEVASALQKCIRRGLADDALFWATELDLAGFGEYVWKRLRIIASEDVGLSDNSIAPAISALC